MLRDVSVLAHARELHQAHVYHEYPGTHDWKYWRAHLPASLEAVTARMHDE